MTLLAVFIVLVFLHSLVSAWLGRTVVTAPILFTAAGAAAVFCVPELRDVQGDSQAWLRIAETGLVLLLFTDASRTPLARWRTMRDLPGRLLTVGLLLSIVLGGLAAWAVFPGLTVWEAGILAAILAPTDAGLGQVIVTNPRVPGRIREALNVEAGLNDGLAVPFLLFFIALASGGAEGRDARLTRFVLEQLGYGAMVGAGVGLAGGGLLGLAQRRGWMARGWQQLGVVALPVLCLLASEAAAASMFIASFVAGLAVQVGFRQAGRHSVEFAEDWGQLFNLAVFFLFGMLAVRAAGRVGGAHVLYAVLSLTVVRLVPVAVALFGTGLSRASVLFIGWFGPRGLASIVLGLVYLEHETGHPGESTIRVAVSATILLSIFAHGLSARPGIAWYTRRIRALPPGAPEREEEGSSPA